MKDKHFRRGFSPALGAIGLAMVAALAGMQPAIARNPAPDLAPMPEAKPGNAAMIELGRNFFFDRRLSGDWGKSCASCHDPAKGWGDGQALSAGYPSMEYFRNTPTILNAKHRQRFLWDGRLDGTDAGTLVRDMITETHTMNMDGRLMQERLKQVPEYDALWKKWRNDDINGMPNYMNARTDVGAYAITKKPIDIGKFQTAQLRDLKCTAPYMHNGVFATLDEVVAFYDKGGGRGSVLKPLNLSAGERKSLVAFLLTLSGDPVIVKDPRQPDMQTRAFGKN